MESQHQNSSLTHQRAVLAPLALTGQGCAPARAATRRLGHRHVRTVARFRHPVSGARTHLHSGATLGRRAFLGLRPDTGAALVTVRTWRFRTEGPFAPSAYGLPAEL
ncbi:hypothetical protein ACFV29_34845 [Streptomyces sp. NPDC059690]|uniref:hypothetical protein n=1 Tax=Streptomyces sp. NPDC059690 TaxID=3346907 RepID=UPI00367F2232